MVRLPITINAAKIGETSAHKAFTFDLSRITDAVWWSAITDAEDIIIKDSLGNIKPRVIDSLDNFAKTGVITWDAVVSTAENKTYYLEIHPGYGAINSTTAFTNENCLIRHSLDGGASPLVDSCGNYNLTNVRCTLAQPGKLGKAVVVGGTEYLLTGAVTQIQNAGAWTITMLIYLEEATTYQNLISELSDMFSWIQLLDSTLYLSYRFSETHIYASYNSITTVIQLNQWNNITVVFDGALTSNDNRLKLYINGQLLTASTWQGSVGTTIVSSPSGFVYGKGQNSFLGSIDEVRHFTDAKSAGWNITNYNMIFDAGAVTMGD